MAHGTSLSSLRSFNLSPKLVTWLPVKHRLIESCLVYCTCKQKQRFCWLPSVSDQLETEDLKNIWREIEMMNCHLYLKLGSETASDREQLHKILAAALWSEGCLSWLMSQIFFQSWDWTWKSLRNNKYGLIFVAQSKLIAFYWKTLTFLTFGQMCLSEVLCYMMLKLSGPWHKSQQLTQLQPVSEARDLAACEASTNWILLGLLYL